MELGSDTLKISQSTAVCILRRADSALCARHPDPLWFPNWMSSFAWVGRRGAQLRALLEHVRERCAVQSRLDLAHG
jgi:hypothetical protein